MAKLKYVLRSEKFHKTNKQLNDMQDQFSFKTNRKKTLNKTKQKKKTNPKQKTIPPPKQPQTQTFFFSKPAQHPAWGLDFSKELSSHLCS